MCLKFAIAISFVLSFFACKNPEKEKKKILGEFKKADTELAQIDSLPVYSEKLYNDLMARAGDNEETRQMYYTVNDFYNGYSWDLKDRFQTFVGEALDSIALSAKFFRQEKRNDPEGFFDYLHEALGKLQSFAKDNGTVRMIEQLVGSTPAKKTGAVFLSSPPVAVFTMIEYYRHKLSEITVKVLQEYFKEKR